MASLLKGLKNWVRGKRDDAAKAVADPVRDGKFAIEDAQKEIDEFKVEIRKYNASIKQVARALASKKEEVKKWTGLAKKAADGGDETDVRKCVAEKQRVDGEVKAMDSTLKKDKQVLSTLKSQRDGLQNKVNTAKSNHTQLAVRQKSAKLRSAMAAKAGTLDSGSAFAELDNLKSSVDEAESMAEAVEEEIGEGQVMENLEEKYSGGDGAVDDEVAKLMANANK
tara:strand:+ start:56490 stop:57161 length:672 start_codon:yes stop_codon:yes gene_type:complete